MYIINLDKYSFKQKLLFQNLVVVLFISIIIFLFFPRTQESIALDRSIDYLETFRHTTSITIHDPIEFLDKGSADIQLEQLNHVEAMDFIAVYSEKKTLFTTLNDSAYQLSAVTERNMANLFLIENDTIFQQSGHLYSFSKVQKHGAISGYLLISFGIDDVLQSTQQAYTVSTLIALVSILLSILLSNLLSKPILAPISQLIGFFKLMADGKGDLTKRLTITATDEFGILGTEFNRFLDAQNTMINDIKNVVETVDERIDGIEGLSEKNSKLISQLNDAFELISSSAYDVYKGATHNVESAQTVTEKSEVTIRQSKKSQKAADKSITLMDGIKKEVVQLEKDMTELHENSKKIKLISDTLQDIADRTTILALNTSIEANKAGDAGAGFIVIAQEIQNLAEQSAKSLEGINTLNRQIQGSLDQSFKLTVSSAKRVEEGRINIEETGIHILESAGSVQDNLSDIQEVLKIATEQQSQIKEIVQYVTQSSTGIGVIRESVTDTLSSVKEQKSLLNNLSALMGNFKVTN